MPDKVKFRAAEQDELPLVWQILRSKAIFADLAALSSFWHKNPTSIQISEGSLNCLGIVSSWRSHLEIGTIRHLVAPEVYKNAFLDHLINVLANEGYKEIISPPLRRAELPGYHIKGFKEKECIIVMRRANVSKIASATGVLEVCKFKSEHLNHLVKVDEAAFPKFWRWDRKEMLSAVEEGDCFVAFLKGRIIGYNVNAVKGKDGTIARLAILPELQGRGFGSELLGYALHWFRKMKAVTVFVITQSDNENSRHLYTKFGFKPYGEKYYLLVLEL